MNNPSEMEVELGFIKHDQWRDIFLIALEMLMIRYKSSFRVVLYERGENKLLDLEHNLSQSLNSVIKSYNWVQSVTPLDNNIFLCTNCYDATIKQMQFSLYCENETVKCKYYNIYPQNKLMVDHWKEWTQQLYNQINEPISSISLLDNEHHISGEMLDNVTDKSIYSIFHETAIKNPTKVILMDYLQSLTYKDLLEQIEYIGNFILEKIKGQIDNEKTFIIGVHMERSTLLIATIMSILRIGGTYLPIDKSWPQARIEYILKHSGAKFVLSDENNSQFLNNFNVPFLSLSTPSQIKLENECPRMDDVEQIPFIIYTSGSTGNPKGVIGNQQAFLNRCKWMWSEFPFETDEILIHKTSIGFTDSLWEIFGGLLHSIPLIVVSNEISKDAIQLIDGIEKFKITRLVGVPSFYRAILEIPLIQQKLSSLKVIVSSGETLPLSVAKQLKQKLSNCILINLYGSTEVSSDVTFSIITDEIINSGNESIPIGKPINNAKLYILDKNLNPVPSGFYGNLYVSGICLNSGYWNDLLLTKKYFINHPITNEIMYNTGDIVYFVKNDDVLYYFGRSDSQVKIRGHRIELREIEKNLEEIHFISQVAVICITINEIKQIIAYVTTIDNEKYNEILIKEKLSVTTPYYMIPWKIFILSSFPLTSNGKIDKINLKQKCEHLFHNNLHSVDYNNEDLSNMYEICSNWLKEILFINSVNFNLKFTELGGDSLSAIRFLSKINESFKISLNVQQLLSFSSLNELLHKIQSKETLHDIQIPAILPNLSNDNENILSNAQKGIWFLEHLHPLDTAYMIPIGLRIYGDINIDTLRKTIFSLLSRHSLLRAKFGTDDHGKPCVSYTPIKDMNINTIFNYCKNSLNSLQVIDDEKRKKINVLNNTDYPLKITFIEKNKSDFLACNYLIIQFHHIISDGWSIEVFLRDFSYFYRYHNNNNDIQIEKPLNELKIQYSDYATWQKNILDESSSIFNNLYQYWEKQLENIEETCGELPNDVNLSLDTKKSNAIYRTLSQDIYEKISEISKMEGITVFSFFMSCLYILIHRCSSHNDITITTPTAMRNQSVLEDIIGIFVNTLAIRIKIFDKMNISQLFQMVSETLLHGLQHSEMPFDILVQKFYHQERHESKIAFSQIMIVQEEKSPEELINFGENIKIESLQFHETSASNDITLFIDNHSKKEIRLRFHFSCSQFSIATQENFSNLFIHIVHTICNTYSKQLEISKISMISNDLYNKIINQWNSTKVEIPENKSLFEFICEHGEKNPNSLAVKHNNQSISYKELILYSKNIANWINIQYNNKIPENTIIGLYVSRGIESIIGIIGIIAAGCAYTPLDPSFPIDRNLHIIEQSKLKIILISSDLESSINDNESEILFSNNTFGLISDVMKQNFDENQFKLPLLIKNLTLHVAAVLFTSGTTEQPKGVQLTHSNIISLVYNANWIEISKNDIISQLNTLTFDLALCEIFSALLQGAGLCIIEKGTLLDPNQFKIFINEQKLTIVVLPTSVLHIIGRYYPSALGCLSYVIFGGEKANTKLTNAILTSNSPPKHLVNIYGPTEITFACSYHELKHPIPENLSVPIGTPMSNSKLYIFDKNHQLVPPNIAGEIVVGGSKVALGYLSNLRNTNKFIQYNSENLYCTGDFGKYDENGIFYFLNRNDHQVKIRGFRVEPDEVNQILSSYSMVDISIVIVKESNSEKFLVAFYQGTCSQDELRNYLISKIPDYMVPRIIRKIDKFPLTDRGKIDIRKLPSSYENVNQSKINHFEKQIKQIFEELLGITINEISKSFFQLGGNSLLTMRLLARLRQTFHLDISLQDIFKNSSIEEIAKLVNNNNEIMNPIKGEKEIISHNLLLQANDLFTLSRGQIRIWIDQNMSPNSPHYNVPLTILFEGELNILILQEIIENIINENHILRSIIIPPNIDDHDDEPKQKYLPMNKINTTINKKQIKEENVINEIQNFHMIPFDYLNNEKLLFRSILFQISNTNKNILCMTFHHIICDGWSINLIQKQIINNYITKINNKNIKKEQKNQYYNYISYEKSLLLNENQIINHKDYKFWSSCFLKFKKLNLSIRNNLVVSKNPLDVEIFELNISKEIYNKFLLFCNKQQCTPYIGLLSIFYSLLYRYSSQKNISIASIIANRSMKETDDMIGFLVNNSLSFVNFKDKNSLTIVNIINQLKEFLIQSMDHSTIDFSVLLELFKKQQQKNHSNSSLKLPSMQEMLEIVFILQEKQEKPNEIELNDNNKLKIKNLFIDLPFSKFNLCFECIPLFTGDLKCIISYSKEIYPNCSKIMKNLLYHFKNLINEVIITPNKRIIDLKYLTNQEIEELMKPRKTIENLCTVKFSTIPQVLTTLYPNPNFDHKIAIQSDIQSLTFNELFLKIKQFAIYLMKEYNIQIGDRVLVLIKKGILSYIIPLTLCLIGAIYVPVEKSLPKERINSIINSASITLIITENEFQNKLKFSSEIPILMISNDFIDHINNNSNENDENLLFNERKNKIHGDDICYILFTSGTTGTPKGVAITQNNVVKRFYENCVIILKPINTLQVSSVLFDPSIYDIFRCIFSYSCLTCIEFSVVDTDKYLQIINKYSIECFACSTALLEILILNNIQIFKSIQFITFGGSVVNYLLLLKIFEINPNIHLYNLYGPTETTFSVSKLRITPSILMNYNNAQNIGKIVKPAYYYIVDENLNLLPKGFRGELLLGGYTVSKYGYINDIPSQSKIFFKDPFIHENNDLYIEDCHMIYRSGDIVFENDENFLFFYGRKDKQVKINGNRIELEEIKSILLKNNLVKLSHICILQNELCLIYTGEITIENLYNYLNQYLPHYMVPRIVKTSSFPLQANTKIDCKKLEEIIVSSLFHNNDDDEEENPLQNVTTHASSPDVSNCDDKMFQQQCNNLFSSENEFYFFIKNLWEKVLGYSVPDDNQSFLQIGGTSLRLLKLFQIYQNKLPEISIQMSDLLIYSSLKSQFKFLWNKYQEKNQKSSSSTSIHEREENNQEKEENNESNDSNDIAIIGMDCFVPKCKDIYEFWENLKEGKDCITRDLECKFPFVCAGGILDHVEDFDYRHFKLTRKQASLMDPQHRWLLESSNNVLQHSCIDPKKFQQEIGDIGIFTSLTSNTYHLKNNTNQNQQQQQQSSSQDFQLEVAGMLDSASTRIAFALGLLGPAMAIQTACSSSLVAIHTACQSLQSEDCKSAIISGVSITFPQLEKFQYEKGMILSPEGKCKSFDSLADGIVSGNGVGSILIMKLNDAIKNNYKIHGIIKGSAVNNDGKLKASYHSGNINQHINVIKKALKRSNVNENLIQYVEAHGAGTVLGDLIECSAISNVYKSSPLILGSVKSNIGHLGPAAGIIGLIKTLLCFKNQIIPKTIHFKNLHPHISSLSDKLLVPLDNYEWKSNNKIKRYAAVHSFGQGGTNAHCILEEPPLFNNNNDTFINNYNYQYYLLVFSASSWRSLRNYIQNFIVFLSNSKPNSKCLFNIANTLQHGRTSYSHRKTFTVESYQDAIIKMKEFILYCDKKQKESSHPVLEKEDQEEEMNTFKYIFLFPGQGTEFTNMAKAYYGSMPLFKTYYDQCDKILQEKFQININFILFPNLEEENDFDSLKKEDICGSLKSQLTIFIVSYCLAKVLLEFNIIPYSMIGHSFGEYVCACISEVICLYDALFILIQRGKLINLTQKGKMIALRTSLNDDLINKAKSFQIDVAAQNSSTQIVFSGEYNNMNQFENSLKNDPKWKDIKMTILQVSNGFHSRCIDPILIKFKESLEKIKFSKPKFKYISSVTGKWIKTKEIMDINYWISHLRNAVMFYNSLQCIFQNLIELNKENNQIKSTFIQIGPGNWMKNVCNVEIKNYLKNNKNSSFHYEIPDEFLHPKKIHNHISSFLSFIGKQWENGKKINWKLLYQKNENFNYEELPFYPYERVLCSFDYYKTKKQTKLINQNSLKNSDSISQLEFNHLKNDVKSMKESMNLMQENIKSLLLMNQQLLHQIQQNNSPNYVTNHNFNSNNNKSWFHSLESILIPLKKQTNHSKWGLSVSLTHRQNTEYYLFGSNKNQNTKEKIIEKSSIHLHESKFPIGCLSSCFVLCIFEEMIKNNEIKRFDKLNDILPSHWNLPKEILMIQLHQLASHTSGLPCLPNNFLWNNNKNHLQSICNFQFNDLINELKSCTLLHHPGEKSSYSPLGISLLAFILTCKSKNSFDIPDIPTAFQSLLTKKILKPQQLYNTTIRPSNSEIIQGYKLNLMTNKANKVTPWECGPIFTSADGIYSSLYDLTHFLNLQVSGNHSISHYLMFNQKNNISWSVGLTPSFSCWMGYSSLKQTSVVLILNTEMEISLELSKLGERCMRLLDNEFVSQNDTCSIINSNILKIWKGLQAPANLMDHLKSFDCFDDMINNNSRHSMSLSSSIHNDFVLDLSTSHISSIEEIEDVIEQILIEILWGRKESLDMNTNWTFEELGIDSLQLLVVASEIQSNLPTFKFNVNALFDFPTIHSLAVHLFETNLKEKTPTNNNDHQSSGLSINSNENEINNKQIDSNNNNTLPLSIFSSKDVKELLVPEIDKNSFPFSCCMFPLSNASSNLPIIFQPKETTLLCNEEEKNQILDVTTTAFISKPATFTNFLEFLSKPEISKKIEETIIQYGGVLLRGFNASTPEDFSSIISHLFHNDSTRNYKDGISPRTSVLADQVFTSTEYPSQYNMDLHNEMSYSPSPPKYIMFFCHTAPSENCGGETPIAFSKDIYNRLDKNIRSIFEQKGLLYVTNLPSKIGGHKFGLSWQSTYNTENPSDVENFCHNHGIFFKWISPVTGIEIVDHKSDEYLSCKITLRTERKCPAVRKDELSGNLVWFNHAHLFHPSDLPSHVRSGMEKLVPTELFPKNCFFGDKTIIPDHYLTHIRETMRSCEVSFSWEKGDLLLLNNLIVCHGRHSFTGNRKILVSMK